MITEKGEFFLDCLQQNITEEKDMETLWVQSQEGKGTKVSRTMACPTCFGTGRIAV